MTTPKPPKPPVTNTTAVLGIALISVLLAANFAKLQQIRTMDEVGWEYDVVTIGDDEWDSAADKVGSQGWEIVSARRASDARNNFAYECIVKRRKQP